jgi:hypothetical protein
MNKGKLQILDDGLAAYCPACKTYHLFNKRWTHNGDFDEPSFTPSMHVNAGQSDACHSFLTDGIWHYCEDSKHEYAGRSIALDWEGETVHVLPIDDLREHEENNDGACWCNPRIEQEENGRVIIHNPLDGREILESLDLKRKDIPNHLALVAKHWLSYSDTDDLNVAIALRWLQKRHKSLAPTLGADEALTVSLVNYFDTFLRSLIEGD